MQASYKRKKNGDVIQGRLYWDFSDLDAEWALAGRVVASLKDSPNAMNKFYEIACVPIHTGGQLAEYQMIVIPDPAMQQALSPIAVPGWMLRVLRPGSKEMPTLVPHISQMTLSEDTELGLPAVMLAIVTLRVNQAAFGEGDGQHRRDGSPIEMTRALFDCEVLADQERAATSKLQPAASEQEAAAQRPLKKVAKHLLG